jgi:hypothetical protein
MELINTALETFKGLERRDQFILEMNEGGKEIVEGAPELHSI